MSTRLQIRNALKRRITLRTDLTDPDYDKWIDDGLLDLATRRVELRSLQGSSFAGPDITISQTSFTIPTTAPATIFSLNAIVVYETSATDGATLIPWDGTFQMIVDAQVRSQGVGLGRPAFYLVYGTSVMLWPIADKTYHTLLFPYYRPALASAESSLPSIELEWHYAIELIAAEHAWRDLGDEERAAAAESEFSAWLAMRDTPVRQQKRHDPRNMKAKPHPLMRNPRTGV